MSADDISRWRPYTASLHCWEDGDQSTCMLPDGHAGEHEFTPDSESVIKFKQEDR